MVGQLENGLAAGVGEFCGYGDFRIAAFGSWSHFLHCQVSGQCGVRPHRPTELNLETASHPSRETGLEGGHGQARVDRQGV